MLASLRESVVLYALLVLRRSPGRRPQPRYAWEVDPDLARHAGRFVSEFNALFDERLPEPIPDAAETYWIASDKNEVRGRCMAIGRDLASGQFYHWAVRMDRELTVEEFWNAELWTTARYRKTRVGPSPISRGRVPPALRIP